MNKVYHRYVAERRYYTESEWYTLKNGEQSTFAEAMAVLDAVKAWDTENGCNAYMYRILYVTVVETETIVYPESAV